MNAFALSGLLTGITSSAIGIFVFIKQRRAWLNKIWVMLTITVAIWGFGCWRMASTSDENEAFLWYRLAHIGVILIPIFIYHFVYVFLDLKKKKVLWGVYTVGSIFFIANLVDIIASYLFPERAYYLIIAHMKWIFNLFYMDTPPGPIYPFFVAFFCGTVIYIYYELGHALKESKGLKRSQVKYFFFATIVGFIGGGSSFLPVFGINVYPFGNFATAIWPFIITYAIWQYNLLDIRVAVTRAGIFAIVYAMVLGIPFCIGWWGRPYLERLWYHWWLIPTGLCVLFATAGPFVYIYMQKKAEDRIFKKQRRAQHILEEKFKSITLVKDLDKVLKLIVRAITMVLRVDYSAVFLLDKRTSQYKLASQRGHLHAVNDPVIAKSSPLISYIQEYRAPLIYEELKLKSANANSHGTIELTRLIKRIPAQVIIPSFIKDDLIGFVVLGNKTTGEIYNEGDLLTLTRMSNYSALAIEYAQFLKEYEEVQAKLREAEKLKGIAQLMHSLNHELLNLFNKMSMPMQLIQMGDISPNDKVNFDNALKTISDAMETSIEILGYISSYRNKSKFNELKSRKIDGSIDNALNRFSKRFQEASIKIIKTIQPDLPDIQAKDTFDDLFINILANCYFAIVDKIEGERLIEIQSHLSEGKNTIQVKISDTGADMTKSTYMTDIDSPFKERGKIGGVNFGLAYLITNQHDGSLEVESYEKGGTAFVLNIPVMQ